MKKKNIAIMLGFAALSLCSGCGTVLTHMDGQGGIYSGVRADARLLATANDEYHDIPVVPWVIPFSIIDMPLSAVADTLFLPFVLLTGQGSNAVTPDALKEGAEPGEVVNYE